jgi:hypothetical protein
MWKVKELVNIKVEFPEVATRDRTALVTQLVQEVDVLGVTSRKTAATELGREYDEELELGAKPLVAPPAPSPPGKPIQGATDDPNQPSQTSSLESQPELANSSARQFDNTSRAIQKILGKLKDGSITRVHAKQMLMAVGMQDGRADALLDDAEKGQDVKSLSAVESVLIEAFDESKHPRDHGKFAEVAATNSILEKHGFKMRSEIGSDGEQTIDHEDLKSADADVTRANAILQPHGIEPAKLQYSHARQSFSSTVDPETAEGIDDDIHRSNKILEQHGLPKATVVKDGDSWKSSHDADDLEYDHKEVKRVNKLLEKHGLEPKIKLVSKGGNVGPSHDLDDVESALDSLKDFRKGKLTESVESVDILRQFGLVEVFESVSSNPDATWNDYP